MFQFSVVLVAAGGLASLRRTLSCLRQQTIAETLEIVIVTTKSHRTEIQEAQTPDFAAFRTVEVEEIARRGAAAAAGIRQAAAPLIGLLEDHSFPQPGWAEALVAAHRGPWAGVGPRVENANPESAVARVSFWLAYAAMSGPQLAGVRQLIPWHNSAYKRKILEDNRMQLPSLLDWEGDLQQQLLAQGHELYFEPAAVTYHLNVSSLRHVAFVHMLHGRILAGVRVQRERWPFARRILYALAAPVFPFLHLRDLLPQLRRLGVSRAHVLRDLPTLLIVLMAFSAGELVGHLAGAGRAVDRLSAYELRRESYA